MSLAAEAAAQGSSVRDLERRVRELGRIPPPAMASSSATDERTRQALAPVADPAARRAEDELRRYLQTDVQLQFADSAKGVVRIAFYSHDDLDRLLDLILRERREDF